MRIKHFVRYGGGGKGPEPAPAPEEETDVIDPEGVKKARESAIKEQNRTTRKKLTVPLGGTLGAGSGLGIG